MAKDKTDPVIYDITNNGDTDWQVYLLAVGGDGDKEWTEVASYKTRDECVAYVAKQGGILKEDADTE